MCYSAESVSQSQLSRAAAERYAQLAAVREQRALAKKKVRARVRPEVVKAA
jgi:hypothetical protein